MLKKNGNRVIITDIRAFSNKSKKTEESLSKNKSDKIVNTFIFYNGHIQKHAEKHDNRPDVPDDWIADKDISYWKGPIKSRKLLKYTLITYKKDLIDFVMDNSVNVMTLKVKCNYPVGYLCREGDNVWRKVNWICIVIQKTRKGGLFTKTYYPCANPNK